MLVFVILTRQLFYDDDDDDGDDDDVDDNDNDNDNDNDDDDDNVLHEYDPAGAGSGPSLKEKLIVCAPVSLDHATKVPNNQNHHRCHCPGVLSGFRHLATRV